MAHEEKTGCAVQSKPEMATGLFRGAGVGGDRGAAASVLRALGAAVFQPESRQTASRAGGGGDEAVHGVASSGCFAGRLAGRAGGGRTGAVL